MVGMATITRDPIGYPSRTLAPGTATGYAIMIKSRSPRGRETCRQIAATLPVCREPHSVHVIRAFHPWQNGLDRPRRPSPGTISHGDNCRAGALRQWECRSPGVCQGQNGRKQEAKQSFVTCNIIPSGMHHHYPMLSKQRTSKDHVNLQIRNPRFSIPVF